MAVRSLRFVLTGEDKSASKALGRVGKSADKLDSRLGSLAGGLAGGALAAGLVTFGKSSVAAFKDAEQQQASFQAAFEKFPKLADVNADALGRYNSALARKTIYDDDAIGSGQAVLAQFNLTGKQIQKVTPLLLDYASKTGTDLPTAATNLGRALLGNARSLKSIGINYKLTGDAGKDFENIQRLVNEKVGGFAQREGKTAAGQAKILSNQYGELQESVGAKLVPALNRMGEELLDVIDFTDRNSKVIKPLVITIGGFAAAVWGVNTAMKAWKATETAFLAVKGLFTTAVVAEGVAARATAGSVTVLAASETAAGTAGVTGAAGVGAFAASLGTLGAAFVALVGTGYFAKNVADLALHANDGGGDFAHQPLDPRQTGGSANGGSTGYMREGSKTPTYDYTHVRPRPFGLAMGGTMYRGGTYLTGEEGPELITAGRSGYVHTAPKTRSIFNKNARLDASQVQDNRLMSQMMLTPLRSTPRFTGAYTPPGMRDYYKQHTTVNVTLSRSKVAKQTISEGRRRARNGHPLPFGL